MHQQIQKNRSTLRMQVDPCQLSIIVTTSPIRSHPDTQVIDDSINSILRQPSLTKVHIYIICDGAKITHQNQYKSGLITAETQENYLKFKSRLSQKYTDKTKYTIIEREHRHGFAQNIKYVMEQFAKTPYVMIYQHDHVIQKIIDFAAVVNTIAKFRQQINYVTFMHKSYKNIIPKLLSYPRIKQYIIKLAGKDKGYNVDENLKQFYACFISYFENKFGLPLVPLNFWYDKVHIASRNFYLTVIFNQQGNFDPQRAKNMKTVSFPEDTFGHCMKSTIAEHPQKILEYGAYILWDKEPVFYHQSGRAFMTEQQRKQYLKNIPKNKQSDSQSQPEQQQGDLDIQSLLNEENSKS